MKILEIKNLPLEGIKVIRFARFLDARGYFTEALRKSQTQTDPQLNFLQSFDFPQCNESFSLPSTVRGLHLQWNPYVGKLVRTVFGRMVDIILDVRKGSPTFGKAILYNMPAQAGKEFGEWIWLPPGFAHGNFFTEETIIQYFCSGEYNPECEAGLSVFANDIDWSLTDPQLKKELDQVIQAPPLMSDKDKAGLSITDWSSDKRSDNFIYGKI